MAKYSVKTETSFGTKWFWVGIKTTSGFIYHRKYATKKDALAYAKQLNSKLKNPTRIKNPKKFNVVTSSGKKFQVLASSERAAKEQLKAMFGSTVRMVNPTIHSTSGWIRAKAVKISKGRLLIKR